MSRYSFWDDCFDEAVRYIKEKARSSDLRDGYYKIMSERNWKSSEFNQLIDVLADAERTLSDEYRRLGDAIADMVDGHFAMVVLQDRDISDRLPDRQYDQMKDAYAKFEDLCAPRRRRDDEDRGRGRGRDRNEDRGGGRREESFGESTRERSRSSDRNGRSNSSKNDDEVWGWLSELEQAAENGGEVPPQAEPEPERERTREEPARRHAPDPSEFIREERPRSRVEGPDFTKADPYGEFWMEGEHWMVAHRSDWKIGNPESADWETVPSLHDLNLYVKYYVKDTSGNVREEFYDVSKDNAYLNQEVRLQRGEQPAERRSGGIDLQALRRGQAAAGEHLPFVDEPAPIRKVDLIEKLEQIAEVIPNLTDGKPVDSITTATFAGRSQMLAAGEDVAVTLGYMRTPMAARDWNQLELIDQITDAPSLAAAAQLMNDLRPQFEESIWNKLNERFTGLTLHALKYQFQYNGVNTMNFAQHFGKVIDHIAKKRGDEFASMLGERSRYVSRVATSYADRKNIGITVGDLCEGADQFPAVVFLDFLEIITIDATLDEMGLSGILSPNVANTGLTVGPNQRKLSEAMRRTYEAMQKTLGGSTNARLLLSTADNFLIEITPFSNRTEAFVLSVVR